MSDRLSIIFGCVLACGIGQAWGDTGSVEIIHSFNGADGEDPVAGLVLGVDGNFYGTTSAGGPNAGIAGEGTVFKITSGGSLTILFGFGSAPAGSTVAPDGAAPQTGLIVGNDGNFYGTTSVGGTSPSNPPAGSTANDNGTIFRITSAGALTTLYSFDANPGSDGGRGPTASLTLGSDGNLYGSTYGIGAHEVGTLFKLSSDGSFTTLHDFGDTATDGGTPSGALIQGADGNFYGTTLGGGPNEHNVGAPGDPVQLVGGTVYRLTPAGALTIIYGFGATPAATDGDQPSGNLVLGDDGNFYGTTQYGGTYGGGTVFKITSTGSLTTLYSFGGVSDDGERPYAGLVKGGDGNFYGTTVYGGSVGAGNGTAFEITPEGALTTLHNFGSGSDGALPFGGLIQARDGAFYGTTDAGGANGGGTVFKLTVTPSGTTTGATSGGTTGGGTTGGSSSGGTTGGITTGGSSSGGTTGGSTSGTSGSSSGGTTGGGISGGTSGSSTSGGGTSGGGTTGSSSSSGGGAFGPYGLLLLGLAGLARRRRAKN